jgi:hypothetical protein
VDRVGRGVVERRELIELERGELSELERRELRWCRFLELRQRTGRPGTRSGPGTRSSGRHLDRILRRLT